MENSDISDLTMMDLDLNLEPSDPPPGESVLELGSLLNELETAHGQIEQRIRQLEAVTARARQRQRWRQARNHPEISNFSIDQIGNLGNESEMHNGEVSRSKGCKRNGTYLDAKALEIDRDVKKVDNESGSFFDCNICLDMAREPILTCCGHLFCWACFYQLPYVYPTAKECPMCKGEVIDTNVIPIYGNGNRTHVSELESGLKVPPRPRARRVESVRQQRISRGVSHVPVAEALRRIRSGIGIIGVGPHGRSFDGLTGSSVGSNVSANEVPASEAGGIVRIRSGQFSRVLSESAASLSSISSALNDAERLVDNLESYVNDRLVDRTEAQLLPVNGQDHLTVNTEIDLTVPLPSSSRRTNVQLAFEPMENVSSIPEEIDLEVPRPSSSRRRVALSREARRRRLR